QRVQRVKFDLNAMWLYGFVNRCIANCFSCCEKKVNCNNSPIFRRDPDRERGVWGSKVWKSLEKSKSRKVEESKSQRVQRVKFDLNAMWLYGFVNRCIANCFSCCEKKVNCNNSPILRGDPDRERGA
ncbi:hypothetical protein, partial [Labilibaculum euxinus]|uniref:hypothetical protein n=1 Tax=Labilibaculum euxinus TaxID=2686357 RepID=UPI001CDBD3F9